jgi:hypothetical protein
MQTTPPRPRRGQPRLNAQPPELRIPRQTVEQAPLTSDEADLVELIDRLAAVADGSGLAEIELSSGGTRVVVRSRAAVAGAQIVLAAGAPAATASAAPTAVPSSSAAPTATSAASAAASSGLAFAFARKCCRVSNRAATRAGASPLKSDRCALSSSRYAVTELTERAGAKSAEARRARATKGTDVRKCAMSCRFPP